MFLGGSRRWLRSDDVVPTAAASAWFSRVVCFLCCSRAGSRLSGFCLAGFPGARSAPKDISLYIGTLIPLQGMMEVDKACH